MHAGSWGLCWARAYPGVQRGLWPAERRLEVQREECVRGRQEASQSLPSLALGLKEINCVLWFWTVGQKSVAPTVQWVLCCIQEADYNCQRCNFFFLDVDFLCKWRLLKKTKTTNQKPNTYCLQFFTTFIGGVRRALAALISLQDQGLSAALHSGALLLVMSVVSNAQIYVFYIA